LESHVLKRLRKSFFWGVVSLLDNKKEATTNHTTFFMGKKTQSRHISREEKKI
jgi:hypothetical protein